MGKVKQKRIVAWALVFVLGLLIQVPVDINAESANDLHMSLSSSASLTSLEVLGHNLYPNFAPNIFDYTTYTDADSVVINITHQAPTSPEPTTLAQINGNMNLNNMVNPGQIRPFAFYDSLGNRWVSDVQFTYSVTSSNNAVNVWLVEFIGSNGFVYAWPDNDRDGIPSELAVCVSGPGFAHGDAQPQRPFNIYEMYGNGILGSSPMNARIIAWGTYEEYTNAAGGSIFPGSFNPLQNISVNLAPVSGFAPEATFGTDVVQGSCGNPIGSTT